MKLSYFAVSVLLSTLSCGAFAASNAASGGCAAKERDIQQQLEQARQHHNQPKVQGLERALSEQRANCNDEQLAQKRRQALQEKRAEVAERQQELRQSQQKGDADKIIKREKKLAEAQQALRELEAQ
ncbi:DUF1090 domain-containing protein [Affinibrenneria salicis]|uniref:DUF1090 domain-containing protein n=1 Tax=Affinibrenneria salicis TaxID=2590031 RepID=A0A5J5G6R3_9GAMM|nr:DUF1090 domain-containing protein [Affinibrenneria salicis]KAA9002826.1 DUF1090 domain-containing protein [Affinibrenneria salicis]KAA9002887.1 DUF1090 domain-containing protein [Affinibrenneria salicis]